MDLEFLRTSSSKYVIFSSDTVGTSLNHVSYLLTIGGRRYGRLADTTKTVPTGEVSRSVGYWLVTFSWSQSSKNGLLPEEMSGETNPREIVGPVLEKALRYIRLRERGRSKEGTEKSFHSMDVTSDFQGGRRNTRTWEIWSVRKRCCLENSERRVSKVWLCECPDFKPPLCEPKSTPMSLRPLISIDFWLSVETVNFNWEPILEPTPTADVTDVHRRGTPDLKEGCIKELRFRILSLSVCLRNNGKDWIGVFSVL